MTYAGFKSLIYAGLTENDPRVKAAREWIEKNYTVEENPGQGEAGLYYYYHAFAAALNAAKLDEVQVGRRPVARLAARPGGRARRAAAGRRLVDQLESPVAGKRSEPGDRVCIDRAGTRPRTVHLIGTAIKTQI